MESILIVEQHTQYAAGAYSLPFCLIITIRFITLKIFHFDETTNHTAFCETISLSVWLVLPHLLLVWYFIGFKQCKIMPKNVHLP